MDAPTPSADIEGVLESGRLLVCCGPGGVGKTTTAAALGLQAATHGRKTIVITIDPAKRLANSLGLESLSNDPTQIALDELDHGDEEGELWAMMLDQEQTFDDLVRRHAPDRGALERSRDNKVYQLLSSALHGMQEYAALDKLHDLYTGGYFDLIVLDTPPTTNALDFLNAPERVSRFFDRRVMKWFVRDETRSSGWFDSLMNPAGSMVLSLLSKLLGETFVDELVEFFDTFHYLHEALRERGDMIEFILRDARTHFFLITSAAPRRIEEVFEFREKLETLDQTVQAYIVNRVTPQFSEADLETFDEEQLQAMYRDAGAEPGEELGRLVEDLRTQYGSLARLAARDRQSIEQLADRVGRELIQLVPILGDDVHTVEDLLILGEFLTPKRTVVENPSTA